MIVKICGITTIQDAENALSDGADWIGFNLVGGPRQLSIGKAEQIIGALGDATQCVALVSTQATDCVPNLGRLRDLGVGRLQVYHHQGSKHHSPESLSGFEIIVVQHVGTDHSPQQLAHQLRRVDHGVAYVLLDTASKDQLGGTGRTANWDLLSEALALVDRSSGPRVLLAGGLNPDNVATAIERVQPAGVDVSSGVEASIGRKDRSKVADFARRAKAASSE